jgi:hypothetical protein
MLPPPVVDAVAMLSLFFIDLPNRLMEDFKSNLEEAFASSSESPPTAVEHTWRSCTLAAKAAWQSQKQPTIEVIQEAHKMLINGLLVDPLLAEIDTLLRQALSGAVAQLPSVDGVPSYIEKHIRALDLPSLFVDTVATAAGNVCRQRIDLAVAAGDVMADTGESVGQPLITV